MFCLGNNRDERRFGKLKSPTLLFIHEEIWKHHLSLLQVESPPLDLM